MVTIRSGPLIPCISILGRCTVNVMRMYESLDWSIILTLEFQLLQLSSSPHLYPVLIDSWISIS
jgi:hypothetical protein